MYGYSTKLNESRIAKTRVSPGRSQILQRPTGARFRSETCCTPGWPHYPLAKHRNQNRCRRLERCRPWWIDGSKCPHVQTAVVRYIACEKLCNKLDYDKMNQTRMSYGWIGRWGRQKGSAACIAAWLRVYLLSMLARMCSYFLFQFLQMPALKWMRISCTLDVGSEFITTTVFLLKGIF